MQQKTLLLCVSASAVLLLSGCQPSRKQLVSQANSTIDAYCTDCHNDVDRAAGLTLEGANVANVAKNPKQWEEVVTKLRAGAMPPSDPKPDAKAHKELVTFLENELDRTTKPYYPPPGLHRLNRAEYQNAVRDVFGLKVDATKFLPPDDSSRGFDNQAGTLGLSPSLLESYLTAAGNLSRLAIGDEADAGEALFKVADDETQDYHLQGLPFGTRGGILIEHDFPVSGRYTFKIYPVTLGNMGSFRPFGQIRGEKLEVLVDGKRVALFDWDKEFHVGQGFGSGSGHLTTLDVDARVPAGRHKIGVTFLATNYAPVLDLDHRFDRSTIETGGIPGFTFFPHVGAVRIDGPYDPGKARNTASRKKIFVCYPENEAAELPCAKRIVKTLAHHAYRGMETASDIKTLMAFYKKGRAQGNFDKGIEYVVHRILADPKFLYRAEKVPDNVEPGQSYRISDLALASRLSFFLWSSVPDDKLLALAEKGELHKPAVLKQQVKRMLADPKAFALTQNFAGQWLELRNLKSFDPLSELYPNWDNNLRQAYKKETELFFNSIVTKNRPVMDLITADYTFVNGRLAKQYGIPGIKGSRFRRVKLGPKFDDRRGLLGKGSLLAVTSEPNRTSPVLRGKFVLGDLLDNPPPPPPPNVPPLKAAPKDPNAPVPTMRQQMDMHAKNPPCSSCHALMDPIGYTLEPFSPIGTQRVRDEHGNVINPVAVAYDGTKMDGLVGLRKLIVKHKIQFIRTFVQKMMTYALGRGTEYYDMPVVRSIVRKSSKDDYRMQDLITGIVESNTFQMNTKIKPKPEGQLASAD